MLLQGDTEAVKLRLTKTFEFLDMITVFLARCICFILYRILTPLKQILNDLICSSQQSMKHQHIKWFKCGIKLMKLVPTNDTELQARQIRGRWVG